MRLNNTREGRRSLCRLSRIVAIAFCVAYMVAACALAVREERRKAAQAGSGDDRDSTCPEEPSKLAYVVLPFVFAWRVVVQAMNPLRVLSTLTRSAFHYVVAPVLFCVAALVHGVQRLLAAHSGHFVDLGCWVAGALLEVATAVSGVVSAAASWCGDVAKWTAGGVVWLCTELIRVMSDAAAAVLPLLGKAFSWLWQQVASAASTVGTVAWSMLEALWGAIVAVGSAAWKLVLLGSVQLGGALSAVGAGAWRVALVTTSAIGTALTALVAWATVALGHLWSAVVYLAAWAAVALGYLWSAVVYVALALVSAVSIVAVALVAVITMVGAALADLAYILYCSFESAARYLVTVVVAIGSAVFGALADASAEASKMVANMLGGAKVEPNDRIDTSKMPLLK